MIKLLKSVSILVAIVVISGILIGVWIKYSCVACNNTVFYTKKSPNKKFKVVVFQRDCGATTRYTTQISILRRNENLKCFSSGNVFIAYGIPSDIIKSIKWNTNKSVSVVLFHKSVKNNKFFVKVKTYDPGFKENIIHINYKID